MRPIRAVNEYPTLWRQQTVCFLRLWIAVQNGGSAPEKYFVFEDGLEKKQVLGDRYQVMVSIPSV